MLNCCILILRINQFKTSHSIKRINWFSQAIYVNYSPFIALCYGNIESLNNEWDIDWVTIKVDVENANHWLIFFHISDDICIVNSEEKGASSGGTMAPTQVETKESSDSSECLFA